MRLSRLALWAAAFPAAALAQGVGLRGLAPAHNWALDLFTPEGFRSMTLRGDTVQPLDANRIHVIDLNITVFSGTAANTVTTILLSPSATFDSKEDKASGTEGVRVIQGDTEIVGHRWTFIRAGEKISIRDGVRVSLKGAINDMLK
ncbi:MAG: hypothetical protein ACREFX_06705 [Opitutaceae bacterium]